MKKYLTGAILVSLSGCGDPQLQPTPADTITAEQINFQNTWFKNTKIDQIHNTDQKLAQKHELLKIIIETQKGKIDTFKLDLSPEIKFFKTLQIKLADLDIFTTEEAKQAFITFQELNIENEASSAVILEALELYQAFKVDYIKYLDGLVDDANIYVLKNPATLNDLFTYANEAQSDLLIQTMIRLYQQTQDNTSNIDDLEKKYASLLNTIEESSKNIQQTLAQHSDAIGLNTDARKALQGKIDAAINDLRTSLTNSFAAADKQLSTDLAKLADTSGTARNELQRKIEKDIQEANQARIDAIEKLKAELDSTLTQLAEKADAEAVEALRTTIAEQILNLETAQTAAGEERKEIVTKLNSFQSKIVAMNGTLKQLDTASDTIKQTLAQHSTDIGLNTDAREALQGKIDAAINDLRTSLTTTFTEADTKLNQDLAKLADTSGTARNELQRKIENDIQEANQARIDAIQALKDELDKTLTQLADKADAEAVETLRETIAAQIKTLETAQTAAGEERVTLTNTLTSIHSQIMAMDETLKNLNKASDTIKQTLAKNSDAIGLNTDAREALQGKIDAAINDLRTSLTNSFAAADKQLSTDLAKLADTSGTARNELQRKIENDIQEANQARIDAIEKLKAELDSTLIQLAEKANADVVETLRETIAAQIKTLETAQTAAGEERVTLTNTLTSIHSQIMAMDETLKNLNKASDTIKQTLAQHSTDIGLNTDAREALQGQIDAAINGLNKTLTQQMDVAKQSLDHKLQAFYSRTASKRTELQKNIMQDVRLLVKKQVEAMKEAVQSAHANIQQTVDALNEQAGLDHNAIAALQADLNQKLDAHTEALTQLNKKVVALEAFQAKVELSLEKLEASKMELGNSYRSMEVEINKLRDDLKLKGSQATLAETKEALYAVTIRLQKQESLLQSEQEKLAKMGDLGATVLNLFAGLHDQKYAHAILQNQYDELSKQYMEMNQQLLDQQDKITWATAPEDVMYEDFKVQLLQQKAWWEQNDQNLNQILAATRAKTLKHQAHGIYLNEDEDQAANVESLRTTLVEMFNIAADSQTVVARLQTVVARLQTTPAWQAYKTNPAIDVTADEDTLQQQIQGLLDNRAALLQRMRHSLAETANHNLTTSLIAISDPRWLSEDIWILANESDDDSSSSSANTSDDSNSSSDNTSDDSSSSSSSAEMICPENPMHDLQSSQDKSVEDVINTYVDLFYACYLNDDAKADSLSFENIVRTHQALQNIEQQIRIGMDALKANQAEIYAEQPTAAFDLALKLTQDKQQSFAQNLLALNDLREALETAQTTAGEERQEISTKLNSLQSKITSLNGKLEQLNTVSEAIKSTLNKQKDDINDIKYINATAKETLSNQINEIEDLQDKLKEVSDTLAKKADAKIAEDLVINMIKLAKALNEIETTDEQFEDLSSDLKFIQTLNNPESYFGFDD